MVISIKMQLKVNGRGSPLNIISLRHPSRQGDLSSFMHEIPPARLYDRKLREKILKIHNFRSKFKTHFYRLNEISVCVCVCVFVFVCVCVSLSLSLSLSVRVCMCASLSLSVSVVR